MAAQQFYDTLMQVLTLEPGQEMRLTFATRHERETYRNGLVAERRKWQAKLPEIATPEEIARGAESLFERVRILRDGDTGLILTTLVPEPVKVEIVNKRG